MQSYGKRVLIKLWARKLTRLCEMQTAGAKEKNVPTIQDLRGQTTYHESIFFIFRVRLHLCKRISMDHNTQSGAVPGHQLVHHEDYNNNYDMKAARRRYLIYINDDEGMKLCPQNVFSCVQVSPSTACVKSCYYRIRVVVDWEVEDQRLRSCVVNHAFVRGQRQEDRMSSIRPKSAECIRPKQIH